MSGEISAPKMNYPCFGCEHYTSIEHKALRYAEWYCEIAIELEELRRIFEVSGLALVPYYDGELPEGCFLMEHKASRCDKCGEYYEADQPHVCRKKNSWPFNEGEGETPCSQPSKP